MIRFASAREIAGASERHTIDGLDKPVEIVGLSMVGVEALRVISSKHRDRPAQINAWLIKQCCPAFRWWTMAKICRRLPANTCAALVKKIVQVSGIGADAVEDAAKNSVRAPGTSSS